MEAKLNSAIQSLGSEAHLFSLLSPDEIASLADYFGVLHLKAGETLFNEGDAGDFIGIIFSGKVEVLKETDFEGKRVLLAQMGKGSFVGELSAIDEQPRSATVVATEDTEILILHRQELDTIMKEHPETAARILRGLVRILSGRLRQSAARLAKIF